MIHESTVLDALMDVIDPELGINIVDLGLIYGIEIDEEGDDRGISIQFTLTYPGCPVGDLIQSEIVRVVTEATGLPVGATIIWNPPWNMERMSEAARLELGYPI
ncbi:aromatic ring hydroxylase [Marispirochaeta aestuarii]|uniref:Aromatic ring hydroxylase n=1 Tax=Marispirochaeta aestuarii TaxID=1963862 RepID=A0A1Y1S206_9SPIO|nr:metal-sulfur cluster assembly factor [Marispirochaeta aestuarii]ORC37807.1 aromatic ring hydroxylase [Marispirochaeta aestuarii]